MTSSSPIRLKIEMDSVHHMHKGDTAFQWPENQRKYWIVAMFCGTLLLYATRSAVPLCMAAMSTDMNWDKEIDVSFVKYNLLIMHGLFYMLWFNFILGLIFIFLCSATLCQAHYHTLPHPKTNENKPRIKPFLPTSKRQKM